jgi:tRNA A-37 threonylcarbamoyl transferase component Bud32
MFDVVNPVDGNFKDENPAITDTDLTNLIQSLNKPDARERAHAAKALGDFAKQSAANRLALLGAGGFIPVLKRLRDTEVAVRMCAASAIAHLALSATHLSKTAVQVCVSLLVRCLGDANTSVRLSSATALANLTCIAASSQDPSLGLDGFEALMRCLDDKKVCYEAARALANFTTGNKMNPLKLVAVGGIGKLVECLGHADVGVCKEAIRALANLADDNKKNQDAIRAEGGIERLRTLLDHSDTNLCNTAIAVLMHMDAENNHAIDASFTTDTTKAKPPKRTEVRTVAGGGAVKMPTLGLTGIAIHIIPVAEITINQEQKPIGSGGFCNVYQVSWQGEPAALKYFKLKPNRGAETEQYFQRECAIMSQLHHPNIIQFYGAYKGRGSNSLGYLMAYMPKGSLRQLLLHKEEQLEWSVRYRIAAGTARAIAHLHALGIHHRDIKSENVLIDAGYKPKLADFGLSAWHHEAVDAEVGTPIYMAPELLSQGQSYVNACDMFSFGLLLWEIVACKEAWKDIRHHVNRITYIHEKGLREQMPQGAPKSMAALIAACWHRKPERRPSAPTVLDALNKMEKASSNMSP